jgi:DNA (cytosine-5)-methyltransferase 1
MQNITLEKIVKVKIYDEVDNRLAIITHYLHNYSNGVSKWFKDDTYQIIGDYLHKTYEISEPKMSIAAESAIDGLLFEV